MKAYKCFRFYKYIVIFLAIALLFSPLLQLSNVVQAATIQQATVTIATNVTAKMHNVQLIAQDKVKLASFTIEITNNSSSRLSLLDYWAKIKTKSGKTFQTRIKEMDKTKEQVPAKGRTYITYYAHVDLNTKYSDLALDLIKWNFNSSNYEQKLGTLNTPANQTGEIAAFSYKPILFNDLQVRTGIKQYMLYTDSTSAYVTFQLFMQNQGIQKLDLSTLRLFLQSDNNQIYALDTTSLAAKSLQPKESNVYSLQTVIPKAELNRKFSIIIAGWEETGKVNIPAGMLAMPQLKQSVALQPEKNRLTFIQGKPVNVSISNSYVSISENKQMLSTQIGLENISTSKIDVSNLEFYVKTKDGYLYPLKQKTEGSINILPKIKQTVELEGQIPDLAQLSTSTVVVMSKEEGVSNNALLAVFKVVAEDEKPAVSGPVATYSDYHIEQTSMQRIPMDLTDLIVTEFKITNKSKAAKAKLPLIGQFIIDGVKMDAANTKIVVLDELTTIGPNQSYNVLAYTEIPYNQSTNKIELLLTEKVNDTSSKTIHQFSLKEWTTSELISGNSPYTITSVGKRAEVQFIKSAVIKGTTSDFFYSELEYTNKESRAITPAQLAGYIQNEEGSVINVNFSEYKERILPDGKLVLSAWVSIPKSFGGSNLNFYFGESFKLAEGEKTAVVKPVYTPVVNRELPVKNDFTNLSISNYLLSMRNVYATISLSDGVNADGISLSFDYDLVENANAYPSAEQHKLLIEFVDDGASRATYSQELTFDAAEMKEDTLKVGERLRKTVVFKDSSIFLKTNMEGYTINIYNVFQGNKMLLATKEGMTWFKSMP